MSGIPESLRLMYAHDATVLTGIESGSVRWIPLTQGKFAIVDAEDYEWIAQNTWHSYRGRNTFYAARGVTKNGKERRFRMHQAILGFPYGDHKNRNGLDNRRGNLRYADRSLNRHNSKINCNNTSGYRGVYWHKQRGKGSWDAVIGVNGKRICVRSSFDITIAAIAYDKAAVKYYGGAAILNFPERRKEYEQNPL